MHLAQEGKIVAPRPLARRRRKSRGLLVLYHMVRTDGLHIDCTADHCRIPTFCAARLVDLYNSGDSDRMLVLKSEVSAGFIKPLLRGHKVTHMLTPSTEALHTKSLIRAVEETPLASAIAMADVPTLGTLDMAAKRIACGRTENLASAKVVSPMSASSHGVYLVSMYSEGSVPRSLYLYYTISESANQ